MRIHQRKKAQNNQEAAKQALPVSPKLGSQVRGMENTVDSPQTAPAQQLNSDRPGFNFAELPIFAGTQTASAPPVQAKSLFGAVPEKVEPQVASPVEATQMKAEPVQRQDEEEEPTQMKAEPVQRQDEEEEPAQMKAEPVQRQDEEEEPGQMKAEPVQRQDEEEEPGQMKAEPVQRQDEEEDPAQMKAEAVQRQDDEEEPAQAKGEADQQTKPLQPKINLAPSSSGKPMPEPVQQKMEGAFGADFSGVRIHEGPQAKAINAIAYTQGENIHFQPGKYQPDTQSGQELLGHELTHVVQQKAGRVTVPQGKGAPINADPGLESEADILGAKAARGESVEVAGSSSSLQRKSTENVADSKQVLQLEGEEAKKEASKKEEAPKKEASKKEEAPKKDETTQLDRIDKQIDAAKEKKIQIKDRVFEINQKEKALIAQEEEITNKITAFQDADKAKVEPPKTKARKGKVVRDKEGKLKKLNQSLMSVNTKIKEQEDKLLKIEVEIEQLIEGGDSNKEDQIKIKEEDEAKIEKSLEHLKNNRKKLENQKEEQQQELKTFLQKEAASSPEDDNTLEILTQNLEKIKEEKEALKAKREVLEYVKEVEQKKIKRGRVNLVGKVFENILSLDVKTPEDKKEDKKEDSNWLTSIFSTVKKGLIGGAEKKILKIGMGLVGKIGKIAERGITGMRLLGTGIKQWGRDKAAKKQGGFFNYFFDSKKNTEAKLEKQHAMVDRILKTYQTDPSILEVIDLSEADLKGSEEQKKTIILKKLRERNDIQSSWSDWVK